MPCVQLQQTGQHVAKIAKTQMEFVFLLSFIPKVAESSLFVDGTPYNPHQIQVGKQH